MSDEAQGAPSPESMGKHTKWIVPAFLAVVIPFVALALEPAPAEQEVQAQPTRTAKSITLPDTDADFVPRAMTEEELGEEDEQIEAIAEVMELSPEQTRRLLAAPPETFEQMYREMSTPLEIHGPTDREVQMNQRHIVEAMELSCKRSAHNCTEADLLHRQYSERYGDF